MTEATSGLEHKAGAGVETMFGEFMSAFEEFKRTNDGRLSELEKRGSADALTEDKLNRLNSALDNAKAAIDRANVERARPRLEGVRAAAGDDEYKDAFAAYVKRGEEKALRIGSNPDGGYLVPTETDEEISRLMAALSPTLGAGCDCIGLVRGVWRSLYGDAPIALPNYRADFRDGRHVPELMALADQILVPAQGEIEAGQVILFRLGRTPVPKHCGIALSADRFIHAQERLGVIEANLNDGWRRRIAGQFEFPAV